MRHPHYYHYVLVAAFMSSIYFLVAPTWRISTYDVPYLQHTDTSDAGAHFPVSRMPKHKKIVLFPSHFCLDNKSDLREYYVSHVDGTLPAADDMHHFAKFVPPVTLGTPKQAQFTSRRFTVFEAGTSDVCSPSEIEVGVSKSVSLGSDIHDIIMRLSLSEYFQEIKSVFKGNPIQDQLHFKTAHEFWFKFAGSAVYLKEYGVYFLVSRVSYAEDRNRVSPNLSLVYGEIFDELWNLIPDIELIVPSNVERFHAHEDLTAKCGSIAYAIYNAPSFIKVPVYQKANRDYYGPEDPRVTLAKNPHGYEEPIIVFNQNHRVLDNVVPEDADHVKVDLKRHRSMFQCYPWQFSRGRTAVDVLPTSEEITQDREAGILASDIVYHRTIELRIVNRGRASTQKNWTPFFSKADREKYGHDKYIYFIIRWTDLDVLQCRLYDSVQMLVSSSCTFAYRRDELKSIDSLPGLFRGGTSLININLLLEQDQAEFPPLGVMYQNLEAANREVWVGFARAHLSDCGCGPDSFYRPNLVVVTRQDSSLFKIQVVSDFVAFGIKVPSYDEKMPDNLCKGGSSVLIPNSIARWQLHSVRQAEVGFEIDDVLALVYSVADIRTDLINIRGLLGALVNMDYDVSMESDKRLFSSSAMTNSGYDNKNIECALARAYVYCKEYGQTHRDN